jgi:16S rRNA (cytidine1402-2'-O)-methyltransferase
MVATPIGNLSDMTQRGQAILSAVDLIAAEDTRHTGQLLAALGIKKPMISIHDHNEQQRSQQVIEQLLAGKSVAYVSDAGTPAISDPGSILVAQAAAANISVVPVPGASSVLAAICASGLDARAGFRFTGFLPVGNKEREALFETFDHATQLTVLFEAPHRILATLLLFAERFPDRQLVVAKELTKVFERFIRGTAQAVYAQLLEHPDWQRGEFVVLLDRAPKVRESDVVTVSVTQVLSALLAELPLSQAVKMTCQITGERKKKVYDLALSLTQNEVME